MRQLASLVFWQLLLCGIWNTVCWDRLLVLGWPHVPQLYFCTSLVWLIVIIKRWIATFITGCCWLIIAWSSLILCLIHFNNLQFFYIFIYNCCINLHLYMLKNRDFWKFDAIMVRDFSNSWVLFAGIQKYFAVLVVENLQRSETCL